MNTEKDLSISIFLRSSFYMGFYSHSAVCPYGAQREEEMQLFWFLIGWLDFLLSGSPFQTKIMSCRLRTGYGVIIYDRITYSVVSFM